MSPSVGSTLPFILEKKKRTSKPKAWVSFLLL